MDILDTTFLFHYWAGDEAVRTYLADHEESDFITTAINIKEIAVGRMLQGAFDPVEIRSVFDWLTVVPFSSEAAFAAGALEASLYRDQTVQKDQITAPAADVLIAGVANERNATVVTQNTADFSQFEGITVETY